MRAISPLTTEGVVEGGDDEYSTPNHSPVPPDRSGIPGAGVQPDGIVDTDDEHALICPRAVPSPWEPSAEDVSRHNLTHLPYRSRCPHCVAARRNNAPHAVDKSVTRSLPLLVLDSCFLRDAEPQELTTVLCGRLYASRAIFAKVCDLKGQNDKHTVGRLCQFLRASGATDIVYKSDQEQPPLLSFGRPSGTP